MRKLLLFASVLLSTTTNAQMAPQLVQDVCTGCNSNTSNLQLYNSELLFVAYDTAKGRELRSFDGTNLTTTDVLVGKDSGTFADTTQEMISYNGNLFFQGTLTQGKSQLMKWDGTNAPTKITDINSYGVDYPDAFTELGGKIYFAAWQDTAHGDQIYELDPSNNNVTKITSHSHLADFFITEAIAFKGKLYFVTDRNSDLVLYVYDPSNNTTNVAFPTFFTYYGPADLTVIDTMLYFSAIETTHGRELFQYDGYTDTPKMVTDVSPGIGDGVASSGIIKHNNKVYFFGNDQGSLHLFKLWYYDPATQQVTSLSSFNVGVHPDKKKMLAVYKNRLIIKAQDELAFSDGTNVTLISTGDFNPTEAVEFQGDLYMNGYTATTERALFKIDTTAFYLSIPQVQLNGTATLYPNPATHEAHLKVSLHTTTSLQIQLVDLLGQTVYTNTLKQYGKGTHIITIPTRQLPKGIYHCILQNSRAQKLWSEQLVH